MSKPRNTKSRRLRWRRSKQHSVKNSNWCSEHSELNDGSAGPPSVIDGEGKQDDSNHSCNEPEKQSLSGESWRTNPIVSTHFHDYCQPPECEPNTMSDGQSVNKTTEQPEPIETPLELLLEVKNKMTLFLNHRWIPIVHRKAIHVVQISAQDNVAVQRSVIFNPSGAVEMFVHCKSVSAQPFVDGIEPPLPLGFDSIDFFVDRAVLILNKFKAMEVCSGFDDPTLKVAWPLCPFGEVDKNHYQECRYVETFRSMNCTLLVNGRKWRCHNCASLARPLRRRAHQASSVEKPSPFTNNRYLSEEQKLQKLQDQQRLIQNSKKAISRLRDRMQVLIKKQGVHIDQQLDNDLTEILADSKVTPAQSIFLQQQIKASQKKNMVGMRWHPTMIRLALAIHLTSPAAYEMIRDTGMIKLPSSRTLFDYSRAKPVEDGIDQVVLDSIGEKVKNFHKAYKKYHVLMADEMHISQNLVFQKSSRKLIGYTSLDNFDQEVAVLENFLNNPEEEIAPTVATKVLTFMVKGVSSGIKEVVANYPVSNFSADQMYVWTWQVIGALERTGIAVIAFVSDGCSINRAFIKKHKPITRLSSGVIFDTKNKAAPHRALYFMSDVPHLLKTIRNNLLNSRSDKKKSRRHMAFKGKKISWDFIVKLYEAKKGKFFRKSYKLNAMNVYPDSYARMKVKYAAQVLSKTVAQDLQDQGWDDASETIHFILLVNEWFDCLNGAHSSMAKRTRNANLASYTSRLDSRFDELESFLDYLNRWKLDASDTNNNVTMNNTVASNVTCNNSIAADNSIDAEEEGRDDEEATPASKRILSYQTLEGIERSTYAFIDMVKFLLKERTEFVNARVFCQDPLEQHFSKVRAGQGGSTNPNYGQALIRTRALHCIGQLGMKRRRGNAGAEGVQSTVEVTTEPLQKTKCERSVTFLDID